MGVVAETYSTVWYCTATSTIQRSRPASSDVLLGSIHVSYVFVSGKHAKANKKKCATPRMEHGHGAKEEEDEEIGRTSSTEEKNTRASDVNRRDSLSGDCGNREALDSSTRSHVLVRTQPPLVVHSGGFQRRVRRGSMRRATSHRLAPSATFRGTLALLHSSA